MNESYESVLQVILQLTRRHWPDASDEQVYPLVGGFIFLRYINPIVISPETVGLLSVAPTKQLRASLVVLAKMLLALSNNVLFGQLSKEKHMIPLNSFITDNRQRLRKCGRTHTFTRAPTAHTHTPLVPTAAATPFARFAPHLP